MNIVSLDPSWSKLIDGAWIAELDATPFLVRCREGKATRRELHSYLRQQYLYSKNFTRFLCGVMARVGDDDRLELTHNLFEEMGLGDFGCVPHSRIYRQMMETMDVDPTGEAENPATRALTNLMFQLSNHDDPLVGLAALGLGAEAIVPHVYSHIVHGFAAIGEPMEHLEFFHIHIQGDDEHAVTMRKIIEREVALEDGRLEVVRATAERAIQARTTFFEALTPTLRVVRAPEGGDHVQL